MPGSGSSPDARDVHDRLVVTRRAREPSGEQCGGTDVDRPDEVHRFRLHLGDRTERRARRSIVDEDRHRPERSDGSLDHDGGDLGIAQVCRHGGHRDATGAQVLLEARELLLAARDPDDRIALRSERLGHAATDPARCPGDDGGTSMHVPTLSVTPSASLASVGTTREAPVGNRLATSDSLYLRDHADDPVDWWPWSSDSLATAARLGRPLFVSIGYAACHWCHVMAETTFRDPAVAALINEHFLPVKVDREELPDIDARFMAAALAINGSGGWPLTAVATSDGRPAWVATYLPPRSTSNLPGLIETLTTILDAIARDPRALERAADELTRARLEPRSRRPTAPPTDEITMRLRTDLARQLDRSEGGFGTAPKFPQAHALLALWELVRTGDGVETVRVRELVLASVRRYAESGLVDHLDGGIFRYAVDRPMVDVHYEKMLVDQAWFILLLAVIGPDREDLDLYFTLERTIAFVRRALVRFDGLLATSLDADAHGVEGGAYLLRAEEVRAVLGDEAAWVIDELHLPPDRPHHGHRIGASTLRLEGNALTRFDALAAWRRGRGSARRDDKALCDHNAAVATALLVAGRRSGRDEWIVWGLGLARRVHATFVDASGARHVAYGGEARGATSSDELWVSIMALAAWEVTGATAWLERARTSASRLVERFLLPGLGMVVSSTEPGEAVPDRLDGAHPSVSSLALWHLTRLVAVSADDRLAHARSQLADALADVLEAAPAAAALGALAMGHTDRVRTVVVATPNLTELARVALAAARPLDVVVRDPTHPLATGAAGDRAEVCVAHACLLPTSDPRVLADALWSTLP